MMGYSKNKKEPTVFTVEKNRALADELHIDVKKAENEELALAKSHCLRPLPELKIKNSDGNVIWDLSEHDFIKQDQVPESVNPSLWINGKCLYETGIYSVVGKDIIQARGFDVANINFIRGKSGWILLDTGSTVEGMKAALEETELALGEKIKGNIKAVIISHSHGDHFGGITGAVSPEEIGKASEGKIPIYVPKGFDEATRDEYLSAGTAMGRRSAYQVGANLIHGEKGKISIGCGYTTVVGSQSYLHPTDYIEENTTLNIDGIHVDFQLANETEAVSNMQNYFHEYKALWVADDCIGTMHNILTMRGAKIRDAKKWAEVLYDAYVTYGEEAQVIFQGHAHPHWNTEKTPNAVKEVLLYHAAAYQFIHDQSLLYLNQGYTDREIAKKLTPPKLISDKWYLRPYYGDYEFNARAIYTNYVGFYDGNPIHLKPSTPYEEAKQFVEYVGSEELVLKKAQKDYDAGNYQLAAEAANKVVFFNPKNLDARYLCADALEQLGYQSESAIFRNAYLQGSYELRQLQETTDGAGTSPEIVLQGLDVEQILEYLGVILDSNQIEDITQQIILAVLEQGKHQYFLVEIVAGTLLKKQLAQELADDTEKMNWIEEYGKSRDIEVVKLSKEELIGLIVSSDSAKTIVSAKNQEWLQRVQKAVVNLGESKLFHIIEP